MNIFSPPQPLYPYLSQNSQRQLNPLNVEYLVPDKTSYFAYSYPSACW